MKKIILGLALLSSMSAIASETKSSCGWLKVYENQGVPYTTGEKGEKLIQTLAKKNSDAGFNQIVSVNSHMLSDTAYAQYCVTSKK